MARSESVVWFHWIERACRSRTVAGRSRCPTSWASYSPSRGYGRFRARQELEDAWNAAVGEPGCRQTQVGEVRRGVLNVTVAHPALLEELAAFQKPALLAALRRERRHDDSRHPVPRRRAGDRGPVSGAARRAEARTAAARPPGGPDRAGHDRGPTAMTRLGDSQPWIGSDRDRHRPVSPHDR